MSKCLQMLHGYANELLKDRAWSSHLNSQESLIQGLCTALLHLVSQGHWFHPLGQKLGHVGFHCYFPSPCNSAWRGTQFLMNEWVKALIFIALVHHSLLIYSPIDGVCMTSNFFFLSQVMLCKHFWTLSIPLGSCV